MRLRMPARMALWFAVPTALCLWVTAAAAQRDSTHLFVSWRLVPEHPCVRDSLLLRFAFCRGNVRDFAADRLDSAHVRARARVVPCLLCPCTPDSFPLPLGSYGPGAHEIDLELTRSIIRGDSLPDSVVVTHHTVAFAVTNLCPPTGPLPFVQSIGIGRPGPCDPCPPKVCPEESLRVFVDGSFPNSCLRLDRIDLLPSPVLNPLPQPPRIRLVVTDQHGCDACLPGPNPWHAEVTLPPLPPLSYNLFVELEHVTCDSLIHELFSTRVPFAVAERCSVVNEGCFVARFPRDSALCDAFVAPHVPAEVPLEVLSAVPLAGLQGELLLDPHVLRVWSLAPIGPAAGMHLDWRRTLTGARFVMFAEHGAPIPASPPDWMRRGIPVLQVKVALPDSEPLPPGIPDLTHLFVTNLLASDSTGRGVPLCPIPPNVRMDLSTHICLRGGCDWNGDGVADVRDLVLMAHCILGKGACPERFFDCNGDSVMSLPDVFCCARTILEGHPPDTTHGRREPGIAVRFGEPRRGPGGIDLPVTLVGADRIGAAQLGLRFPSGRFDVADVDMAENPEWLRLYQPGAGRVAIGLIGIAGPDGPTGSEVALTVHLALKPGQEVGGVVALEESQFSGPDGVALEAEFVKPSMPLSGAGRVTLAPAQPNPFSERTRFTVSLTASSDLDVAIYDLVGRRVATLYHGRRPGGTHEFAWDGRDSGGGRASSGIYFYRASADGQLVGRKVVFLGGR